MFGENHMNIRVQKNSRGIGITESRLNVLLGIEEFTVDNGYAPTVRELSELIGVSSHSSVHFQLEALEREGYLQRRARRARSCRLTGKGHQILDLMGLARPLAS